MKSIAYDKNAIVKSINIALTVERLQKILLLQPFALQFLIVAEHSMRVRERLRLRQNSLAAILLLLAAFATNAACRNDSPQPMTQTAPIVSEQSDADDRKIFEAEAARKRCSEARDRQNQIPDAIKSSLDRKFPDWQFAKIDGGTWQYVKEFIAADANPEIITGDFDGNRQTDFAFLIEMQQKDRKSETNCETKAVTDFSDAKIVVFLKRGARYKFYDLNHGDFLFLGKKGEFGYDWEKQKKFVRRNDAIETGYFEKSLSAFVFENGKFREIYSLD